MSSLINKIYQNLVIRYPIGIIIFLVLILGFFSIHARNFELDASGQIHQLPLQADGYI